MGTEKPRTRALGDTITLAVSTAITLVGVGVIVGWHLHLRVLVQIIPGVIPMQYNTALCFLILGASSWALVDGRTRPPLPAVGGLFVAVMGALVIFEYGTAISLGVDTMLFYPWERTLSADPGRMALTTAISFAVSGGAVTLLALRPHALAPFAVAHTIPLSFGLTSTLGYLLGVTYVLPFHLGAQMAIHTALAFTAYGTAMLVYAWRRADHGDEGLPMWSTAIAAITVPVFFVGFSPITQSASVFARTSQLLLALVSAVLLGFTAHKLMELKVAFKGLVLISIPLVFVLGFVLLVTQVKRSNQQAEGWAGHSGEVIAQTEALLRSLVEAESSVRGYVVTNDPAFDEGYDRAAREAAEAAGRLQLLVGDNPGQEASARRLGMKAAERMEFLADIEQLMRGGARDRAVELVKGGRGLQIMSEFRHEMDSFLREEERVGVARRQAVEDSWQRFNWLLVAGASADILLALMLAFLFSRGIGRRLLTLTKNAQALAAGEELATKMAGTDEIARLDHVFHDMAQALEKRTAQLEAANKELEAFSYSVSHDLRAPLRAIDGFSRILLEDYSGRLDDEGQRFLNVVCANSKQMGQLIDDLLAFSRLSRKGVEKSGVDMTDLARSVAEDLRSAEPERPVSLTVQLLPPAHGDGALLKQVFVNLISNALKFTRHKTDPRVEVGAYPEGADNVYYVKDNGAGFDMRYANKLFGVFQRLHSAEEFEGTGVGLAIIQRIINRHGGKVWAEGKVGEGATFYFTLSGDGEGADGNQYQRS